MGCRNISQVYERRDAIMRIGAHKSISGGIYKSFERALHDGCEALQVFTKNSNRWVGKELSDKEVTKFIEESEKFGTENISAHASYLINLACPNEETHEKSILSFKDELERCEKLCIPFYVIHPGSHLKEGVEYGLNKIVDTVDAVYSEYPYNVTVLYETTAGMGTNIGSRLEDIHYLIEKSKFSDKLGICLDSCHMYSAGYDFVNDYDCVFNKLFGLFGEKVKVFHLNDSKKPYNSRLDRHELIGQGTIGEDFFKQVINDSRFKNVLGILETPVDDDYTNEIKLLKSYRI